LIVIGLALLVTGCGGDKDITFTEPCGVIIDPLKNVNAKTRSGQKRIDTHFERGVAAKCWTRN